VNINATILGQVISFAIFVWFCMKYVWPALIGAMEERKNTIADGLEAADRAVRDLELAQNKALDQLKEAKQEAAAIIDEAKKRANSIIDESKDKAREEGDRLIVSAKAEIEQESNKAREELRTKVAALAVAGAEKILERSISEEDNRDIVDDLAAQL
jgi:F-type H+-transporting ATPase subunit b